MSSSIFATLGMSLSSTLVDPSTLVEKQTSCWDGSTQIRQAILILVVLIQATSSLWMVDQFLGKTVDKTVPYCPLQKLNLSLSVKQAKRPITFVRPSLEISGINRCQLPRSLKTTWHMWWWVLIRTWCTANSLVIWHRPWQTCGTRTRQVHFRQAYPFMYT